jgi:translation elongation factor P/translation initiation factor 5A
MRTPNVPVEIVHISEVLTPLSQVTDLDSAIVAVGTGANVEIVVEAEDEVESAVSESRKIKVVDH